MLKRKLKDFVRGFVTVFREYRGQTTGMIGLGIIIIMMVLALIAPRLAPDTNDQWSNVDRWRDLPTGAPPAWINFFTAEDQATQQIKEGPTERSQESIVNTLSYDYQFAADAPPKDFVFYVEGEYQEDAPKLIANLIRPDGEKVQLISRSVQGSKEGDSYVFDSRMSLFGGDTQRTKVYRFGEQFQEGPTPDQSEIDITKVAFARANENIVSSPEPLQGEYRLEVLVVGPEMEVQDTRMVYKGRVYGLMGTDGRGRAVARGWVWGARYGLILGLAVAAGSVLIALIFGMSSAYYGGWVDELMQRLNEIVMGIPTLPILVVVATIWGRSIWFVITIMALLYWRGIAKTIRARGLQIRENTYVEAGEALGASGFRIIRGHMIPQMLPYAFAEGALMVPVAIIAAAGLHVLGLGDPNIVTWGTMLSEANSAGATIRGMWWWVLLPGLGITLLGFGFISAGMAVERIVNPKMKQE